MRIKPVFETRGLELFNENNGVQTENITDVMVFEPTNEFKDYKVIVLFSDSNKNEIFQVTLTDSHLMGQTYTYNVPETITKNKTIFYQLICEKYDNIFSNTIVWKSLFYKSYFKEKIIYNNVISL